MRNITVSVDEETHRLARIRAAELDTSVSALVREFLRGLTNGSSPDGRASQEAEEEPGRADAEEEIRGVRSWNEPFDLEAFLNDPNPKIFDPDKVVPASEPFEVDEFIRVIREGRDVGREESL